MEITPLAAEKAGFAAGRVTGSPSASGLTATINLTLKTGAIQQEITVTANAALLDEQELFAGQCGFKQQIVATPAQRTQSVRAADPCSRRHYSGRTFRDRPIVSGGRSNTSGVLFDGQETSQHFDQRHCLHARPSKPWPSSGPSPI